MGYQTAEQIAQRAFDLGLLDERQLRDVWGSFGSHNVPIEDFLQTLVRREFMTNYQVERLMKGDRTGFFFGDYRVLYLVGSGTFARVYRAVHRRTGQIVAVKVLRNRYSENRAQAGLFVREGRVGCALRHPNIVPIYEVVSEGKNHFLVMEFIEGRNLREFVRIRKKLDPLEATQMMIGITDGLRYAFETARLIHRDLKMSNVLVSSRGEAKLVDFGLASMDDTLTDDALADLPNTRTVDYAALERATGVRRDDVRSDIYFLGCIYYNMLTGRPPLDRNPRPVAAAEQAAISRRDSGAKARSVVAAERGSCRQQGDDAGSGRPLSIARRHAGRPARRRETSGRRPPRQRRKTAAKAVPTLSAPAGVDAPSTGRAVMIVESDGHMQDIFRKCFKHAGYRVLVTADPGRAAGRFRQDAAVADCVLFCAQQIGQHRARHVQPNGRRQANRLGPGHLAVERKPTALEIEERAPRITASCCRCR